MKTLAIDERMAPEYDRLITEATNLYLNAEPEGLNPRERSAWKKTNPPPETQFMDEHEFTQTTLEANQRPINPIKLAREAFENASYDNADSMTERQILLELGRSYRDLVKFYTDNEYNPDILPVAYEMVLMTEAYIAGYSRQIGLVGERLESISQAPRKKPYFGLRRWNDGIWVPDEDSHDRWQSLVLPATRIISLEEFYTDHSNHLTIGNPVDTDTFVKANAYVTFQEDATVITYENLAGIFGPVLGYMFFKTMRNEAQHKRAYERIHLGFTALHPDETVLATEEVIDSFGMPGEEGIEDFDRKSGRLALAGILDLSLLNDSHQKLINKMRPIIEAVGLRTSEGNAAWERLATQTNRGTRSNLKKSERLSSIRPRAVKRGGPTPIINGVTVEPNVTKDGVGYPKLISS